MLNNKTGEFMRHNRIEIPHVVPNRILQLDGDMLCYECSGDDQPFSLCTENFMTALKVRMEMAGAEYCNIHLTGADKGGRFDIALVKPYQGNRDGKIKPKHLPALREWVQQHYSGQAGKIDACYHEDQTASDGISQQQSHAICQDARNLSIIMSRDKNIAMLDGLHCDWSTYKTTDTSIKSSRLYISEETKTNILLYSSLGLIILNILINLEPASFIGPAICLIVWLYRKAKRSFTST